MMALTATASNSLRKHVMQTLGMRNPCIISVSPSKKNIRYSAVKYTTIDDSFGQLVDELLDKQEKMEKILISCRSIEDCSNLYLYFKKRLGHKFTYPNGAPDLSKYRQVDMFHRCTAPEVKDQIIKSCKNHTWQS